MELSTPTMRMRVVFELSELAYQMKRQQFRRKHPEASEAQLDQWMVEWNRTRPGAEYGDASGPDFRVSHRLDYLKKQ
jgi:hypothetical protein